jgi:predicted metal-dependent phosphoesterase TrpH
MSATGSGAGDTATARHASTSAFEPPSPARMDLHAHTLRSDGLLTPAELASAAAAAGVRLLAITDHDTLAGVHELSRSGEVPAGLEILPGIEINTVVAGDQARFSEGEVHILGLGVDPEDDILEAALAKQRERRRNRYDLMCAKLRDLGMPIEAALETLPTTTDEDALKLLIVIASAPSWP